MKVIRKNLLSVTSGIICHQCNAKGVMGAGIAKVIRDKWPRVYQLYRKADLELGLVIPVKVSESLWVYNVVGQYGYGRIGMYTDYGAITKAFTKIDKRRGNKQVYIPYGMGCGLAGGDWAKYSSIIDEVCPGVIACKI